MRFWGSCYDLLKYDFFNHRGRRGFHRVHGALYLQGIQGNSTLCPLCGTPWSLWLSLILTDNYEHT